MQASLGGQKMQKTKLNTTLGQLEHLDLAQIKHSENKVYLTILVPF